MIYLVTFLHVIACFFLIIVVLLQSGKAADLAGAFGGMGSQTAFGPRGAATVLSKATQIAAAIFMITSLSLSVLATRQGRGGSSTVLEKVNTTAPKKAPAAPQNPALPIQVQTPNGNQSAPAAPAPAQQAPAKK